MDISVFFGRFLSVDDVLFDFFNIFRSKFGSKFRCFLGGSDFLEVILRNLVVLGNLLEKGSSSFNPGGDAEAFFCAIFGGSSSDSEESEMLEKSNR